MTKTSKSLSIFTDEHAHQLRQLKVHFPFRIVWGAISPDGAFEMHASFDRRKLMRYARSGWTVATVG